MYLFVCVYINFVHIIIVAIVGVHEKVDNLLNVEPPSPRCSHALVHSIGSHNILATNTMDNKINVYSYTHKQMYSHNHLNSHPHKDILLQDYRALELHL